MLRGLRKASSNWLGKAVLAAVVSLLVVSFAIWGIGDMFRGYGRSTAVKIGRTEIGAEQFRNLYTERLTAIGRQFGRPISLDQARALGIDRRIVSGLIGEMLLDERARTLRLGIPDSEISRRITSNPAFQAPNGRFDRTMFERWLREVQTNEQRYVADLRRDLIRRQLVGTITSGTAAPKALVEAANRFENEQRSIEYVLLDRSKAGEVPAPTPEVLAKYFEERKVLFRAPEYRKIVVLPLLPTEQARWVEVSDADLKRTYEERRGRYTTPERRNLQQILFPNMDEARAAAERIAKGTSFDDIAAERGQKDFDLGMMAKAAIIDRAIADAAFALKQGEVSAPVQGRFGAAIVRVTKIEPEQVRSFEEVAQELRQEIAVERAKADMLAVYDKIEDERSQGRTLAEAAEKLKLASRTIEVDRSGRDPSGQPIGMPDPQRLLAAAFATEVGVENDPLQVEGGYVWYEVAGLTPARERTLDEVKALVEARWREDEIANRLKAKAAEMLDKLKAGTALAQVAAAEKLKVETKTGIKRAEPTAPLSAQAIDVIFRVAKDLPATAEAAQPAEQLVFRVTDIVVPSFEVASDDAKRLQEALNGEFVTAVVEQYIDRLQREIGVTVNDVVVNRVLSGTSTPDN